MTLPEEVTKELDDMFVDITMTREHVKLLQELLVEDNQADFADIERLHEQMNKLGEEIKKIEAHIQQNSSAHIDEIAKVERHLELQLQKIKDYCHRLPPQILEQAHRYGNSGVRVRISRAEVITTYDTERLLNDHPELEEVVIDGDSIVGKTIVPEVLERAIVAGTVELPDIEEYRRTIKKRNPSVSVNFDGDEAGES